MLMSGLSANLAPYQSVDLASGKSRIDDVHAAGSKRARAHDDDGVTVTAGGHSDDRDNVTSLG
jgi:hypothetical protein